MVYTRRCADGGATVELYDWRSDVYFDLSRLTPHSSTTPTVTTRSSGRPMPANSMCGAIVPKSTEFGADWFRIEIGTLLSMVLIA